MRSRRPHRPSYHIGSDPSSPLRTSLISFYLNVMVQEEDDQVDGLTPTNCLSTTRGPHPCHSAFRLTIGRSVFSRRDPPPLGSVGRWSPLHLVALVDGCIKNRQLLLQSYFSKQMVLTSSIYLSFDLTSTYFQISSFPCIGIFLFFK